MQILECFSGNQPDFQASVKSLSQAIIVSGRMSSDDWRDPEVVAAYQAEKRVSPVANMGNVLHKAFTGNAIGVMRNAFPQSRLEKMYLVEQFTLWSLIGELDPALVTSIFNQVFPNLPRVTFLNNKIQSVPHIWHLHTMVRRIPRQTLAGGTVVWAGDENLLHAQNKF